jgi:hypothetical protein
LETAIVADSLICATFSETASSKVDTTVRDRVCYQALRTLIAATIRGKRGRPDRS